MWLASLVDSNRHDFKNLALLDRVLKFSPQVSSAPSTTPHQSWLLIYLGQSTRYWNLSPWPNPQKNKNHRFLRAIDEFSQQQKLNWTAAPTAPWAALVHACQNSSRSPNPQKLLSLDRQNVFAFFENCPIHQSFELIADYWSLRPEHRAEFESFQRAFQDDLGLQTLGQLRSLLNKEPHVHAATTERFGKAVGALLRRLQGQDDFGLSWHNPTLPFFERFYLRLEKLLESERNQEPLLRIQESLSDWCERLAHRKALLSRFQIQVFADHKGHQQRLDFVLPKATREIKSLMAIVQERWLKLCQDSSKQDAQFVDSIESIELRSLGFVTESDRQLDLFEPNTEQILEDWAVLIGRLQSKGSEVEVGSFENFESFVPEKNHEWVPWGSKKVMSKIPPSGIRPELLYSKAQSLPNPGLKSDEDFLAWVFEQDAFAQLERIRDPWVSGLDRIYVRLKSRWIYWDCALQRTFVHGIFDADSQSL
jgi:hypothetical protein